MPNNYTYPTLTAPAGLMEQDTRPSQGWTLYDLQMAQSLGLTDEEVRYLLIRYIFPELQFRDGEDNAE